MTSSSKKKKEKKKDFQVGSLTESHAESNVDQFAESQVKSWQGKTEGCERHRHEFQGQM
jgi:hypothetical protein